MLRSCAKFNPIAFDIAQIKAMALPGGTEAFRARITFYAMSGKLGPDSLSVE